jgi:hypothetical protein
MSSIITVRRRGAVVGSVALLLSLLATLGWLAPLLRPQGPALLGDRAGPISGRVYGVSEVSAGLAQTPERWVGATVWVQGVLAGARQQHDTRGEWEIVAPPHLADPVGMAMGVPFTATMDLAVSWSTATPLWAWLRRLPLLGRVLPRPQTAQWGRLATYRVRLRVVPGHVSVLLRSRAVGCGVTGWTLPIRPPATTP